MAFEFFFGVFGLISSDSRSRHKSKLDGDWRLFTPLGTSLFREAGDQKSSPMTGSFNSGSSEKQRPIFSTSGTLTNANSSVSEGVFSSTSSSSASSIASSGISTSTTGSTATLIKPGSPGSTLASPISGKKYEFMNELSGNNNNNNIGGGKINKLNAFDNDNPLDPDMANMSSGEDTESTNGINQGDNSTGSGGAAAAAAAGGKGAGKANRLRVIYCRCVCLFLWLHVLRLLAGLVVEKSLLTLDFYHLGAFRIHFLIPALCLAIQVAAISLIFIRNNEETNWLVPFYSSKDYLIRSRSNFKPKMEDYKRRVNISVGLALILAMINSMSLSAYLVHCVMQADVKQTTPTTGMIQAGKAAASAAEVSSGNMLGMDEASWKFIERYVLMALLVYDILWAIYSTYICFLVSFYFNLICSIMKARFHGISKIIEDLAESNTSKTTNQARKITTLYLEHNEACELLDESNDFWQYLIFFTYFTYIPAYCYCLYNLFFVDFETWPSFITWVIHTHTGFIILLISFSAAGVSTEAHAPYTSLHTLSLIQLPLDVEVNIATFLHRVRGLTIGYSCYDLFAVTNASMSNTAAACASYFLIVADFSRSSVFTLSQMNGSTNAAAAAAAAAANSAVGSSTAAPLG